MSYQATQFVLKLRGVSPAEKAVAFALACHAHSDGGEAYPSMETIAEESGFKYRQGAQKVMRQLEAKGIIDRTTTNKGGRNLSTHYRFNFEYRIPRDAVSSTSKCIPQDAVSAPPKCIQGRGESASLRTQNCIPQDARIVRKSSSNGKIAATTACFFQAEEEQLSSVWNHYLEVFDKDEKFTSAKRKQGLAILRRHQEKGADDPVEWMQGVIDLAKTKSKVKPYFSDWHCIFGKPETYKTLVEELALDG